MGKNIGSAYFQGYSRLITLAFKYSLAQRKKL
jgi:hypothetical protein